MFNGNVAGNEPFFVPPPAGQGLDGQKIPPRNMPEGVLGVDGAVEGLEEFLQWQDQQNRQNNIRNNNMPPNNNNMLGNLMNAFFGGAPHGADPNNLQEGNMMLNAGWGWGLDPDGRPIENWDPNDPAARRARASAQRNQRMWNQQHGMWNRRPTVYDQFGYDPMAYLMRALDRHHDDMRRTGEMIGQQANINAHRVGQNKDRNLALMLQRERLASMERMMGGAQQAMKHGFDSFKDWNSDWNAKIEGEGIPGLTATNPEGPQAIEEEDGVDKFAQAVEPKEVLPEMEWMAGLEGSGQEVVRDMLGRAQTEAAAEIFHPAWDEGADRHLEQQKLAATGVHGQMDATNEERARQAQNRMDEINRSAGEQMANLDYNVSRQGIQNQARMDQMRNQMAMMRNQMNMVNQTLPMLNQGMPNV